MAAVPAMNRIMAPTSTATCETAMRTPMRFIHARRTLRLLLAENESDSADGVEDLAAKRVVHLAAQAPDLHVDEIVDGAVPGGLLPDRGGEHFAGDDIARM